MKKLTSIDQLEGHYLTSQNRSVSDGAKWKEIDHINDHYEQFIQRSPFLILATHGENGLDCSPRGDPAGFVRVVNPKCIQIPDRRGNNRLDSLRNIVSNPSVALLFLIPNVGETIRVSGKAEIVVDEDLCKSFAVNGKPASSVISITVEKAYFQCQKALVRSKLWSAESHVERKDLPSTGSMVKRFAEMNEQDFDANSYDANYPEHMKKTIY